MLQIAKVFLHVIVVVVAVVVCGRFLSLCEKNEWEWAKLDYSGLNKILLKNLTGFSVEICVLHFRSVLVSGICHMAFFCPSSIFF